MTEDEANKIITDRLNEYTLQLSEHLTQTVQGVVKLTVNGKIDHLTKILTSHIEASKPSMDFISDIKGTNRVVQWLLKVIGLLGVASGVIWGAFNYLKN